MERCRGRPIWSGWCLNRRTTWAPESCVFPHIPIGLGLINNIPSLPGYALDLRWTRYISSLSDHPVKDWEQPLCERLPRQRWHGAPQDVPDAEVTRVSIAGTCSGPREPPGLCFACVLRLELSQDLVAAPSLVAACVFYVKLLKYHQDVGPKSRTSHSQANALTAGLQRQDLTCGLSSWPLGPCISFWGVPIHNNL